MTKVVFFGASSVEGDGASTPERRASSLVCRALGWEEVNQGISGTCVVGRDDAGQVIDLDSGLARVHDVLDAQPDLVIIHFGANDFGSSKPIGDPNVFRQGTFFWDYDTLLRGLMEVLTPGQIVLSTAQYRADAETPNGEGLTLADYNGAIRRLAAKYDLRLLDPAEEAEISGENFPALSADPFHLNDAGYERLAACWIAGLRGAVPPSA